MRESNQSSYGNADRQRSRERVRIDAREPQQRTSQQRTAQQRMPQQRTSRVAQEGRTARPSVSSRQPQQRQTRSSQREGMNRPAQREGMNRAASSRQSQQRVSRASQTQRPARAAAVSRSRQDMGGQRPSANSQRSIRNAGAQRVPRTAASSAKASRSQGLGNGLQLPAMSSGMGRLSGGALSGVLDMARQRWQILVAALALIVLVVFIGGCVSSCNGRAAEERAAEEKAAAEAAQKEADEKAKADEINKLLKSVDKDALASLMEDDELCDQLLENAKSDVDLAWIAANYDQYGVDGTYVQAKLLRLAARDPQAVTFVREFPDKYPQEKGEACDKVKQGTVPNLYQWDQRWGYTLYCNTTFAMTGCCPTSMSMVYQGLTGKNDISPYDMGVRAQEGGYMDEYNGTASSFLTDAAPGLGLNVESVDLSADALTAALEDGKVIIDNVAPGDFTTTGHYLVISGLTDDGKLIINDPNSSVNSEQAWDIDQVLGQSILLYAYSLA